MIWRGGRSLDACVDSTRSSSTLLSKSSISKAEGQPAFSFLGAGALLQGLGCPRGKVMSGSSCCMWKKREKSLERLRRCDSNEKFAEMTTRL